MMLRKYNHGSFHKTFPHYGDITLTWITDTTKNIYCSKLTVYINTFCSLPHKTLENIGFYFIKPI